MRAPLKRGRVVALGCLMAVLLAGCAAVSPPVSAQIADAPPAPSVPEASAPQPLDPARETPPPATSRDCYTILPGTDMENEVVVLTGERPGPTLFVVGGIHGDEVAGWTAGNALKDWELLAGTLYILSPANPPGAEKEVRFCFDNEDLNRNFPGRGDGSRTERLARAIYGEIEDKQPALVLDLHEALIKRQNRDFLGNSLIYTSLDDIDLLVMGIIDQTSSGALCSQPFNFFSPGVAGSINREVSERLGIPVITIETYRMDLLEVRVQNQLDIVRYVLQYYEMG